MPLYIRVPIINYYYSLEQKLKIEKSLNGHITIPHVSLKMKTVLH